MLDRVDLQEEAADLVVGAVLAVLSSEAAVQ